MGERDRTQVRPVTGRDRTATFLAAFALALAVLAPAASAFETAQITLVDVAAIESYLAPIPTGEGNAGAAPADLEQHLVVTGYGTTLFNPGSDPALTRPGTALAVDLPLSISRAAATPGIAADQAFQLHARACYEYARTVMEEPGNYRLKISAGLAAAEIGTADIGSDAAGGGPLKIAFRPDAVTRIRCALERVQ